MIYTIQNVVAAEISVRELTYISVTAGVGTGQLVTTLDENDVAQYFFISSDDEVILIADINITSTYNGIPVSLMRPNWASVVREAVALV